MDDTGGVGLGERLARLKDVADSVEDRERSLGLEKRRQVAALEALHQQVRLTGLERADVADANDVLTLQLRSDPRLAREPRQLFGPSLEEAGQILDRCPCSEADVRDADDDAHPSASEDPIDSVLAGHQ